MSDDDRGVGGHEHRLPPTIAVLVAIALYTLLPDSLLFAPRFVIPAIEIVLLVALIATNPRRLTRETRWSGWVAIGQCGLLILANLVALGMLVHAVVHAGKGHDLLYGGLQVWATNVIGFALLYWELDRGGPVRRREATRGQLPSADWRFSQDENHDAAAEVARTSSITSNWRPVFVDYLYLSLTNSSAFSPTDTMPLTSRAKLLMGTQATAALLTSLLVVARAVGVIG
ncbi:hypothetical protein [Allobranchiibius sp. GilTou73]|uniref:hypothetical protein n=1 Tax=Allobranchiibius sp. GilTou73 TaxID=2904523 RepID=UPI001F285E7C|nr:hypothetical protein [Allobranchiibius sp. GilTou73]UIJ36187.1 hypothetical protein LVQ62_07420 [Allobranchiibius sp. GilTou73]